MQNSSIPKTTLRLYGPQNENNSLLNGGIGQQMYGPRCVVVLLLVAPHSDWFWCGRVKIPGAVPFKTASPPTVVSIRDGHLKFAPTRSHYLAPNPAFTLVRAPLRRRVDSHTLFRGSASGLRQPSGGGSEVSLALTRRRVAFTAWLRFAVAFCACILPHHTPRAPQVLQRQPSQPRQRASSTLSQGRCSACRCSFSFARVNIREFNFSCVGVHDRAGKHVSPRRSKSPVTFD